MRKVAPTQRHFKDSTSTFPDSAASGAEPEPPSAREDGNARAIPWSLWRELVATQDRDDVCGRPLLPYRCMYAGRLTVVRRSGTSGALWTAKYS